MTAMTAKQFDAGAREAIAKAIVILDQRFRAMENAYLQDESTHYIGEMKRLATASRTLGEKLGQTETISILDFVNWVDGAHADPAIASAFKAWTINS